MCWNCFLQYTPAPVLNDRVRAMYDELTGSDTDLDRSTLLHIPVSDMNCDDEHFDLTNQRIRAEYDEASTVERAIFDHLAKLSPEERATAVAMDWGYISREGVIRPDCVEMPS